MTENYPNDEELAAAAEKLTRLRDALGQVLFGQEDLIEQVLTCVLARGHVLLEGLPGLGKTELVKGLAKALSLETRRVQFTPDLLPGDITGNPVLQEHADGSREFVFQKGPIFSNLLLADEINRASPKTQSALLEAMQERRVTVLGETHELPDPFFVLATQNPIELEGTYPLPEAQLDRFLFKLDVRRPDVATLERIVTGRELGVEPSVEAVLSPADLRGLIDLARRVYLPPVVASFIARLVDATHTGQSNAAKALRIGASPRAAIGLAAAAKARAVLAGRVNASYEDVQAVAVPVIGHRVLMDYDARLSGLTTAQVVRELLNEVTPHGDATPAALESVEG